MRTSNHKLLMQNTTLRKSQEFVCSSAFSCVLDLAFQQKTEEIGGISKAHGKQLLNLLQHHRLSPQLRSTILNAPDLDEDFREQFESRCLELKQSALEQSLELFRIVKRFQSENISLLSIKGPVLSYQLYGDFTKRSSNDLDFLVDERQLEHALQLLRAEGYEPDGIMPQSPKQKKAYLKARHHYTLYHREKKITLELHWKLLAGAVHKTWTLQTLLPYTEKLTFTETPVLVLNDLYLALYLCVHGSRHSWFRLFWLHDLLSLIERKGEAFKIELVQLAKEKNLLVHVESAFHLLNLLQEKYISEKAQQKIKKLEKLTVKAWLAAEKNFENNTFSWNEYRHFYRNLYLTDGFQGVWNEFRQKRIKPENWSYFAFPDSVFFLNNWLSRPIWFFRKRKQL